MSIQSELTRIQNKRDLSFQEVANKGVTVPAGSTIDDLPGLIALIESGGGDSGGIVYQDLDGYIHLSEDAADVISIVDTLDEHGGTIRTIESAVQGKSGYTALDFLDRTKPVGPLVFDMVSFPSTSMCGWLSGRTGITKLFGTNFNDTANGGGRFREMTSLEYAIFPKATKFYNTDFYGCTNLVAVDWLGSPTLGVWGSSMTFAACPKLKTIIIRTTVGVCKLAGTNHFNNTPFGSNGSGGTIYIPKVLYDELGTGSSLDYKAATNWSTIDGYGKTTWACIEGSAYETQYADGTPIESE